MYYAHNLRANLQEWRNRLYKSNHFDFHNNYNFFFSNLNENRLIKTLLETASSKYPISEEQLNSYYSQVFDQGIPLEFGYENSEDAAGSLYQLLMFFKLKNVVPRALTDHMGFGRDFSLQKDGFLQNFVQPIIDYLHDSIDDVNFTLYLLERYKLRTEWFMVKNLLKKYQEAENEFEKVLDSDLRLYLFDQGIKYPLSTPLSQSGRADIIAMLEGEEPLMLEVKVIDKEKKYGKHRIVEGFSQIFKYTTDYNKNIGYLVTYNLDEIEIKFDLQENKFPLKVFVNGITIFLIVINLNQTISASKIGKLQTMTIKESELTDSVQHSND